MKLHALEGDLLPPPWNEPMSDVSEPLREALAGRCRLEREVGRGGSTLLTTEKIAALLPIPTVRVSTATVVKRGALRSLRHVYLSCCVKESTAICPAQEGTAGGGVVSPLRPPLRVPLSACFGLPVIAWTSNLSFSLFSTDS